MENISAGSHHTCASLDDGSAKCWGACYGDHLGYGDQADRGDAPGEMGDQLPGVDLRGRSVEDISAGGVSHLRVPR